MHRTSDKNTPPVWERLRCPGFGVIAKPGPPRLIKSAKEPRDRRHPHKATEFAARAEVRPAMDVMR